MAGPGEKKGAGKGKQLPAERTATSAQGGGGQRGRQQGVPAQEAEARVAPPVEAGGRRRGRDGVPATEPVGRTGSIPPATAPTSTGGASLGQNRAVARPAQERKNKNIHIPLCERKTAGVREKQ
jgi:hypothetical protein